MIKRFFKRSRSLEALFNNYRGYVIESEFAGLFYVADDKDFAIVRSDGYVRCPLEEVPELIGMLKEEVAEEVQGIYDDLHDLTRMEVEYA